MSSSRKNKSLDTIDWQPEDAPLSEGNSFDIDYSSLRQQVRRYEQDTKWRKYFSVWVMCIVPLWLVLILVIVFLCASGIFNLVPSVLISLLATTTANILGLAYIVLKGIFPQHYDKPLSNK